MRVYYCFLMIFGCAAAFAAETSMAQAQSSPSETRAFHKLREDLGLEPRSDIQQDGIGQITVRPRPEVPVIDPQTTDAPTPKEIGVAPGLSDSDSGFDARGVAAQPVAPAIEPRQLAAPAPGIKALTADDFKHPVAFDNDLFSIAFPGRHQASEDNKRHARKYHYSPDNGKTEFHVEVTDVPAEVNDGNVQRLFDLIRDQILRSPPSRLISDRNRPQSSHPGRELVMQLTAPGQTDMLHLRFVFAGHRLYMICVKHSQDMATSVATAFLDSFRVAKASRLTDRQGIVPLPAPAPAPAATPATSAMTVDDFKHPTVFTGDKFIVAFPGKVEATDYPAKHSRNYRSADGKSEFAVAVFDLSTAENDSAAPKLLDLTRDILCKKLKAQLISEQNRPQNGHPGRELKLQMTGQNQSVGIRLVVAEHRLYVVTATHAAGVDPSVDEAFLDSFKAAETVDSPKAAEEFNNLFK
jgi:hypothetical protein